MKNMTKDEYNRHSHKERLEAEREKLAKDVAEFLKSGGKIQDIDISKSSLDISKVCKSHKIED